MVQPWRSAAASSSRRWFSTVWPVVLTRRYRAARFPLVVMLNPLGSLVIGRAMMPAKAYRNQLFSVWHKFSGTTPGNAGVARGDHEGVFGMARPVGVQVALQKL